MSKCPVCKTECGRGTVCPECGFEDLNPVFLNREEGEAWIEQVVWPWRYRYWKTLTDFEIVGREITRYRRYDPDHPATVIIPYGIERIGKDAFTALEPLGDLFWYRNDSIKEVFFPETVRVIGESAFHGVRLRSAVFSPGLERIETCAFMGSIFLREVSIPGTCREIGKQAFYDCNALETIRISDGVERIGANAFAHCHDAASVTIPASVSYIGPSAFSNGPLSREFFVDPGNKTYSVVNNCLVDRAQGKIISGSLRNPIPADKDIRSIGIGAFSSYYTGKDCIPSLTIPPNISEIEDLAFDACQITNVWIPQSAKVLGRKVFNGVHDCTIRCEAKGKPPEWDPEWCGADASTTVLWGQ